MAYIFKFSNNPSDESTYLSIDPIKGEEHRATRVKNKDQATRFHRTPYKHEEGGQVVEIKDAFYYYSDQYPGMYLDFKQIGTNNILFLNKTVLPIHKGLIYGWKNEDMKLGGIRSPAPESILHWVSCANQNYVDGDNEHNRLRCGVGTNKFTMKVTAEGVYENEVINEKESV